MTWRERLQVQYEKIKIACAGQAQRAGTACFMAAAAADAVADVPCILCISFTMSVVSTALQSAQPSADKALTIFPIYFVSFAQQ